MNLTPETPSFASPIGSSTGRRERGGFLFKKHLMMKRENIYKASELDARILKIDQETLQLSNKSVQEIKLERTLLPELFEELRVKKIEALAALRATYVKQIEEMA